MPSQIPLFREALRLNPDLAEAHADLGVALFLQGQVDEAIAHFRTALRVKPDAADVHSNLGAVLNSQGNGGGRGTLPGGAENQAGSCEGARRAGEDGEEVRAGRRTKPASPLLVNPA